MMLDFTRLDALIAAYRKAATVEAADVMARAIRDYFAEELRARAFLPVTLDHRCFRCGAAVHTGDCQVEEDPFIEWVEPLDTGSDPVYSRARRSHIAKMRRRLEPRYESDEQAVEDFMIVHWAWYVTDPTRGGGPESPQNSKASQ
jgi:hypothetical protein